ncbi:MAG TPA: DUF6580 family putative transport protein [Candidatus Kapabacteria bacterium]|nr:DUF6580 family putative transport protein [Candidatus Kapabacteria bacterium]
MQDQNRRQLTFAVGLVLVAIASRVVFNHFEIFNFSMVMSAALFGGAFLTNRVLKFTVPVAAMLATDAIIGMYNPGIMLSVYGAFLLTVFLGDKFSTNSLRGFAGSVLGGSLAFFVLTNLAVFAFGDGTMYAHTWAGLALCFDQAIPFYRNTLLSDLLFSTVFFGGYELFKLRFLQPATVR